MVFGALEDRRKARFLVPEPKEQVLYWNKNKLKKKNQKIPISIPLPSVLFYLLSTHFLSSSLLNSPVSALQSRAFVGGWLGVYRADKWQMTIAWRAGDKPAKAGDAIYQASRS